MDSGCWHAIGFIGVLLHAGSTQRINRLFQIHCLCSVIGYCLFCHLCNIWSHSTDNYSFRGHRSIGCYLDRIDIKICKKIIHHSGQYKQKAVVEFFRVLVVVVFLNVSKIIKLYFLEYIHQYLEGVQI